MRPIVKGPLVFNSFWVFITRNHRLDDINNRRLFSQPFGEWKFEIRLLVLSGPGKDLFLACRWHLLTMFPLGLPLVPVIGVISLCSSSYTATHPIRRALPSWLPLILITSQRAFSKCTVMFQHLRKLEFA